MTNDTPAHFLLEIDGAIASIALARPTDTLQAW